MLPSAVSLMPEKLLDTLSYQEVRDLFAYLQSDAPKGKQPPMPLGQIQQNNAQPLPSKGGKKLKVLLISGSLEYKSDQTLAAFQKYLEANYPVKCLPCLPEGRRRPARPRTARQVRRRRLLHPAAQDQRRATRPHQEVRHQRQTDRRDSHREPRLSELAGNGQTHLGRRLRQSLWRRPEVRSKDHQGRREASSAGRRQAVEIGRQPVQEPASGEGHHGANDRQHPRSHGTDRLGPRIQGRTNLLHLTRASEGFRERELQRMITNAIFWTAKRETPAK